MSHVFKIAIFVFLSLFTVYVQSQSLLDKLPKNVSTLSAEEQAAILNKIAVFSYQALLDVPQQGLAVKRPLIKEVISGQKWLQARQQPLFQLLALQIQRAVDFSIFNEIWRENRTRLGLEVYTPFKVGSFDKPLLTALLQLNELSEKSLIEYALSLEGETTNFLRQQNYPLNNYLNGVIFEVMPPNLAGITGSQMTLGPFSQLSKQSPGDELFIKTLASIDEAGNTRVAMRVYLTHGGFPKAYKERSQLIEEELQRTPRMLVGEGNPATDDAILATVELYVEHSPSSYSSGVTILLYPFFREENNKLFPESFRKFAQRELAKGVPFKPGQWLTFKD